MSAAPSDRQVCGSQLYLPLPARAYLWLMTLAAMGFMAYWQQAWRGTISSDLDDLGLMAALIALAAVAQHFPLMVGPRRKVNVSTAAYFASLLLFGAPVAVALVGTSQLLGQATLALRRDAVTSKRMRSARSVLFNTSQLMVATGLGGLVYYSLLPHLAPAPLERIENLWAIPATATVVYLANTLAVAVMVGLQLRQSPAESWLSGWRTHTLEFAGLFVIGLMTAIASINYPWAPLLMALPTAILYLSLKHTVQLLGREQAARVEAEAAAESVRRLQAVVEQERATLASVMASMSDGLLALDAARRIRYCNARAGELLGIAPAAVMGASADDVIRDLALSLAEPGLAAFWDRLLTHPVGHPRGEFTLVGPPRRDILVSAFRVAGPTEATLGLLLRDVSDSKQLTRLEERERIAMDLHDGVIQSLYGVALGLGARARTPDQSPDETRSVLCQAVDQINSAIHEIRSYVFDLRQPQSDDGLAAELMALISELQVNTLLRAELDLDPAAECLVDPDAVPNLVQIAREATCNVVRHANASTVRLRLARTDEQLVLMVCDNGKGFRPTNAGTPSGQGLSNMAERARALGGRLVVVSEPARGTEVRVEVPVAMLGR